MERLTKYDTDGQAMMDCQKCEADWTGKHGKPMADCTALYCRNRLLDRLVKYEDTERTPEEIDMDHEAAETLRQLCQNCDLDRLEKLAEADKEGRLFLLPLEPGRPMLCQEHFERTWVMKNVAPCVQYQSSVGVVFHMEYDVFRGLVERGKITPLSPEGEKALEAMKDE